MHLTRVQSAFHPWPVSPVVETKNLFDDNDNGNHTTAIQLALDEMGASAGRKTGQPPTLQMPWKLPQDD